MNADAAPGAAEEEQDLPALTAEECNEAFGLGQRDIPEIISRIRAKSPLGLWRIVDLQRAADLLEKAAITYFRRDAVEAYENGVRIGRLSGEQRRNSMMEGLPNGYVPVEAYVGEGEIIVLGTPADDDEMHDCDRLGCSSVGHVVYRESYPTQAP